MNLAKLCQVINREGIVMHVFAYAGGIKGFAADKNLVKKLCLNKPEQAKNINTLKQMACVTGLADIHKATITNYQARGKVSRLVQSLENNFIDPFLVTLEATKLFKFISKY